MLNMAYQRLIPRPSPAASYEAALELAARLMEGDGPEVDPRCRTALHDHGRRTPRSYVLIHGYTNCPQQFAALARLLFAQGANVLIPRMPAHGLLDRLTSATGALTARDLARFADAAVDCACGLGEEVAVVGLSSGGVLAAWLAQGRADLARALVISPAFGPGLVAPWLAPAAALALRLLPNRFAWWDDQLKERLATPPYGYPRFATRGLSAAYQLGAALRRAARRAAPAARSIVVVTNAADRAVSEPPIRSLLASWRARRAVVQTYTFPAELGLPHDLIDPHHIGPHQAEVYPLLLSLLEAEPAG
jgi:carboxylesterase